MVSIVLGYDFGVMSGASLYIKKDLDLTDVQLEILIGIMNLYSLIGSFAAGRTSDWIGRRYTVVFVAGVFFVGSLLMGFAAGYAMLMAGRFVAGVGVGYAIVIAPVYTAEIAPASARGFLTSFPDAFINFGILLGYVEETRVWKELIFAPSPAMRRILLTALGVQFFQQASGIDSVVLYSPRVFQSAGITDDNPLLDTTCAVAATKTLFILVTTFLVDRVGRRPLLLSSAGGTIFSLVGLGTELTVVGHDPDAKITWAIALCIVSTLAYVSFFSGGLGPLTSVYTSEIFPLRMRALGFAVGVTFFLYAGMGALACVFFSICLPETRGLTLKEMGKLFGMTADDTGLEAEVPVGKEVVVEMPTN
ncbi:Polyol transporter 5 [Dichanthelium oligosanthes]|uniref:Polyol transporter 5 n=1 Tax=Dichanthelium oligosanthes TaxID=888268 RepID=A0A1E5VU90_9POAL|nr:Polyol transporter 5 [Dichanthelium oligosanthes]